MKTYDVIVVGAGLFGCTAAKYLKSKRLDVVVVDSGEEMSASKCALGVWKDGWGEKIKDKLDISLPILDELYGIETVPFFDMDTSKEIEMKMIDCEKVLKREHYFVEGKVAKVEGDEVCFGFKPTEFRIKAKMILICSGVWTDELLFNSGLKKIGVERHWGANMEVALEVDCNRIQTWAPYKQSVLLKTAEDKFLFSDGVKLKEPKSTDNRVKVASDRIQHHLNDIVCSTVSNDKIIQVREGLRPFLPKDVEHFNKHGNILFSATGGGKNSLILSGWIAYRAYQEYLHISEH